MHVAPSLGIASPLTVAAIVSAAALLSTHVGNQDRQFSGADAYEQFMGRWSRMLAPLLVRFAAVSDGDVLLDVGSGTGALTGAIASAAPRARITGIDPSEAYIAFAQKNTSNAAIHFEVGDAQQLRFGDATFDRTLSLLVLNFIPDPAKALREMRRVTRHSGTIAAAVWDYGDGMEMLREFWSVAVALEPANDKSDERHMPLCRRGELAALWRQAGLRDVVEEPLVIETRFTSFDDYWMPFTLGQGPAGAYVARLSSDQREALRLRLRERLLVGGPDRPIVLRARAWAVKGVVP